MLWTPFRRLQRLLRTTPTDSSTRCTHSRGSRARYPEEVKPVAETLGEVTLRDSLSDSVRLNATAGLGRIVGEYPSIAVEIVDDVATLFDADNPKLRNNAIGLIGDVAIVHTDVVEPYTEEITALLTVEGHLHTNQCEWCS